MDQTDDVTGGDIVERGSGRPLVPRWRVPAPRWLPPRIAVIMGLAGLLAGLAAGYAAGAWHAGKSPAGSQPSVTAQSARPLTGSPLTIFGPTCSVQIGRELQLGVQVTNDSPAPVLVRRVSAVLPIGGLRPVSWSWGPCGELPAGLPDQSVATGNSIWVTVTFQVLVSCPGPLPVQFNVGYSQRARPGVASLPAFPDLSRVAYSGCQ